MFILIFKCIVEQRTIIKGFTGHLCHHLSMAKGSLKTFEVNEIHTHEKECNGYITRIKHWLYKLPISSTPEYSKCTKYRHKYTVNLFSKLHLENDK